MYKSVCKAFIFGVKDSPTEAEIEAYRKDCGYDGSEGYVAKIILLPF
jgi:hypothetical protein